MASRSSHPDDPPRDGPLDAPRGDGHRRRPAPPLAGVGLNLLVALDALLVERSVSAAAARMSVGQSAMTRSLARLRELFDDPLLVRRGREMVATPLAASLIGPVRNALAVIEQTLAAGARFDPAVDERAFAVMASDYVTYVFLRPLLARLGREAPGVHLHLLPVSGDHLERLRRGRTDLLIMPREFVSGDDLPTTALFGDSWVCAVDRDNADVGDTLTIEQFSRQPYLSYHAGRLPSLVERQLDAAGIARNLEVTVETFVLALYLLRGTRLVTLIHERLGRDLADEIGLRLLEPPMPLPRTTEVMAWPAHLEHDPAHAWLRGRLQALAAAMPPVLR